MDKQKVLQIKEQYPSICYDCQYARRPWSNEFRNEGYVGCCLRALDPPRDHHEIEVGEAVASGWVDLKSDIWNDKGSGMVTNEQLVTLGIKSCKAFIKNK